MDHRSPGELTRDRAHDAIRSAFDTWQAPDCATLCFREAGLTDKDTVEPGYREDGTNQNVVVFEQSSERWADLFGNTALSATIVTSQVESGTIVDADIVTNDADYVLVVDGPCPDAQHADVLSVLTHEVGHFAGLNHTTNRETTMYGSWGTGEEEGDCELLKRDLAQGDIAGICTVYEPECPSYD